MVPLPLLGWRELSVTQDPVLLAKLIAALEDAGLPHRLRTQALGHADRRSGLLGAVGEDPRYAVLSQLYVKKGDFDRASRLWAEVRRGS